MNETEKLLLKELAETKARLIVAEQERDRAETALAADRRAYQAALADPDQQVYVCGVKLGEYKEIVRTIHEWRRLGEPSLERVLSATRDAEPSS